MKLSRIFLVVLVFVVVLSGCRVVKQTENMIENRVDAVEDAVEQTINSAANALLNPDPYAPTAPANHTPVDPSQLITMEQAQSIALEHAECLAEDVVGLHTVFDVDDGRQIYEVEFRWGHIEYEYEVDAATGAILSFDRDD